MRSADFESPTPYTDTAQSKPRRSSQSSTAKSAEWVPSQDPSLALRTVPRTHHEVQQQAANSDSGHNSSQSSPSSPGGSTVGKKESSLEPLSSLPPLPLSASKPRRPKSQIVKGNKPFQDPLLVQDRYSFHPGGQTEVQVYTADTITYADLDPKAFMRPENRVLPTSDLKNNSKTAYAKINVSKSQLV